ncbi:uncharacterized protein LOC143570910 [Bidens hawaiensis]|uniref:uncharacterized protein LOC143570910 n=1 Tax=Bidens hawaiensis TaxID=980011 RepID=UPI004049A6CB
MKKRPEMSSLGMMTTFLGLQISQSSTGILLHQGKYSKDLLAKFEFHDSKSAAIPMAERPLLSSDPDGKPIDQTYYRSIIGSLMYLIASRPDIIYGGDDIDRKSTSTGCRFLGNRIISWQCKKQQTLSTSTTEAEFSFDLKIDVWTLRQDLRALLNKDHGNPDMRKSKIALLKKEFNIFTQVKGESFAQLIERFCYLVNEIKRLKINKPEYEYIDKLADALPKEWGTFILIQQSNPIAYARLNLASFIEQLEIDLELRKKKK